MVMLSIALAVLAASTASALPRHGIVGGEEAEPHSIPWQVSLRRKSDDFHFCGGSVVGPSHVVSAAHCSVIWDSADEVQVVAGGHNNASPDGMEQVRDVVKITVHEDYQDPKAYENDIAVWELAEPLFMDERVAAVPLPTQEQQSTGECSVSGWGTLSSGGHTPDVLMVVSVPVVTDQTCRIEYPFQIADSMICAGKHGKDSCQGDSGGPMVCYNDDGSGYLGGVVSWGIGCGGYYHPGVYTEVSYFADWLADHTSVPTTAAPTTTAPTTAAPTTAAPTTAAQTTAAPTTAAPTTAAPTTAAPTTAAPTTAAPTTAAFTTAAPATSTGFV